MNIIFDYSKLRGLIISKYGNQTNFAKALNTNKQRVSMVLNNKAYLSTPEVFEWCKALDIDLDFLAYYFFVYSNNKC